MFIKHNIDGFLYTGLEEYLRERQIKHVMCAGLATPICVFSLKKGTWVKLAIFVDLTVKVC